MSEPVAESELIYESCDCGKSFKHRGNCSERRSNRPATVFTLRKPAVEGFYEEDRTAQNYLSEFKQKRERILSIIEEWQLDYLTGSALEALLLGEYDDAVNYLNRKMKVVEG